MSEFSSNTTASRAVLKDRAKGALEGHYGTAVAVFFLMTAVTWMGNSVLRYLIYYVGVLFAMAGNLAGSAASVGTALSSASTLAELLSPYETALNIADYVMIVVAELFTGVLKTGICLFCLNLCCGRRTRIFDLFFGYRDQFGKSLRLSLVNTLISQLYLLPANLLVSAWSSDGNDTLLYLYAGLTAVGFALYAYLSLYVAMSWYLLLDFPDRSASELLRLSARVIRGHKGRLFALYLSFLPLELLNLCTFGIGGLWIRPYIRTTYTEFFLDLMSNRE